MNKHNLSPYTEYRHYKREVALVALSDTPQVEAETDVDAKADEKLLVALDTSTYETECMAAASRLDWCTRVPAAKMKKAHPRCAGNSEEVEYPYLSTPSERAALFRKELLSSALEYAAKGYPVFPALMIDGQKKPLVKWGKGEDGHPDLTKRRATTDPETIKAWWARWPLAMIGMPTGKSSGVVVLDIDRKNGVDGLANLRAVGIDPYSLSPVISITPSGGLHVFMRYNGPLKNSAGLLAAGVDIRGDGGYVVLPPSLPSITRDEYQWEGGGYGCL